MHGDQEAAMAAVGLGILAFACCFFLIALAINAFICYLVAGMFKALPQEHQKQSPGLVWLMLIPLFNIVWSFFVYPKLSESYASYFAAKGDMTKGDCNKTLATVLCVLYCCCLIPYLNALAGLGLLVVLIIYLVKMNALKNEVQAGA